MDKGKRIIFFFLALSFLALLVSVRYYVLGSHPDWGLPKLEMLPAPYQEHSKLISPIAILFSVAFMMCAGRVQYVSRRKQVLRDYEQRREEALRNEGEKPDDVQSP